MSQNTKALDGDLEDLRADIGRIFAAIELKHAGWRIAALRTASQEFATALFSIFRTQTAPVARKQLARILADCATAAVTLQQRDVVQEALVQFDQVRLPAEQLRELVISALRVLQDSRSKLSEIFFELDCEIEGELELRRRPPAQPGSALPSGEPT